MPLFFSRASRDQYRRNQQEAQRIVASYGHEAKDIVLSRIENSADDARSYNHWKRVLTHVDRMV